MRPPIINVQYYNPDLHQTIYKLLWVVDIPCIGEHFTVYLKDEGQTIMGRVEDVQWTGCDDLNECGQPEVTIVLDVK